MDSTDVVDESEALGIPRAAVDWAQADRAGEVEGLRTFEKFVGLEGVAQILRHMAGLGGVKVVEQQSEFITTKSSQQIAVAGVIAQ